MLRIPNEVLPGQGVEAADMTAIIRSVKAHAPRPSLGERIATGSGGTTRYRILRPAVKQWPLAGGGGGPLALQPGSDVSNHSAAKYTITYGTTWGAPPTIGGAALVTSTAANIITLGASDVRVYAQIDVTFTSVGTVTITDRIISSTPGALPTSTLTGGSSAGGSGTLYVELFGVTVTAPVGTGPYTVRAAPSVGGSFNAGICLSASDASASSFIAPWGI